MHTILRPAGGRLVLHCVFRHPISATKAPQCIPGFRRCWCARRGFKAMTLPHQPWRLLPAALGVWLYHRIGQAIFQASGRHGMVLPSWSKRHCSQLSMPCACLPARDDASLTCVVPYLDSSGNDEHAVARVRINWDLTLPILAPLTSPNPSSALYHRSIQLPCGRTPIRGRSFQPYTLRTTTFCL